MGEEQTLCCHGKVRGQPPGPMERNKVLLLQREGLSQAEVSTLGEDSRSPVGAISKKHRVNSAGPRTLRVADEKPRDCFPSDQTCSCARESARLASQRPILTKSVLPTIAMEEQRLAADLRISKCVCFLQKHGQRLRPLHFVHQPHL